MDDVVFGYGFGVQGSRSLGEYVTLSLEAKRRNLDYDSSEDSDDDVRKHQSGILVIPTVDSTIRSH